MSQSRRSALLMSFLTLLCCGAGLLALFQLIKLDCVAAVETRFAVLAGAIAGFGLFGLVAAIRNLTDPSSHSTSSTELDQKVQTLKDLLSETNQQLQNSEDRFRFALEKMPVLFVAFDATGNISAWNAECDRVTGYSAAEVIGNLGIMAQLYPNAQYLQQQIAQWQARGDDYRNWEWDLTCKDGSVRTIAWSNIAAKFPVPGWATWGIGVDVTERKRTEQALAQANERFRLAMSAIDALVYEWDLERDKVERSEGTCNLFGFPSEAITANSDWWLKRIHPEDIEIINQQFLNALQKNDRYSLEYRVRNHEGEYVDVHDQGLIVRNATGKAVRVVGSTTDITGRKRAEVALQHSEATARAKAAELEAFMEAVPIGVWVAHDPQCHDVTPNQAAYEMMRRSHGSVMTATPADGEYPFPFKIQQNGQDVASEELPMQQAGRSGEAVSGEFEFVFDDGDICFLYGKAVPVRYESGNIRGVIGAFVNITHHKQAETALRESEARFRQLAESIGEVFWIADLEFTQILYVSPAYEKVWGQTCQSLYDQPSSLLNAIHPDDRDRALTIMTAQRKTGFNHEYRIVRADGSIRWIWEQAFPVYNDVGQPYRIAGVSQDITDRKQIEVALRESQDRLELALDAARIGSWDWDVKSSEVVWTPYHEMIFGYEPGTPRRTYQEWCDRVHPDDLATAQASLQQAMEEKRDYACDYRVVWTDGSIHWVSSYGRFHYDSNGQPTRMLGMLFDITDRKQTEAALRESESMFRTLADTMPQLFWVIDSDSHHDYCNQRLCDYSGLTLEQMHDDGWQQMVHPDDLSSTIQAFTVACQTGAMFTVELRLRRASDGEYRWHLAQALPFHNQSGELVKWFGSSTDIHDQKLAIEERAQALERERAARIELERASRMKDEFLAVVSHELRSPLNAILGWSRLLRTRTFNSEKTEQALAAIERNAIAQTQLIEDLLDISRIIRGKIRLDLRPTHLIPCVQAAIDTIRPAATAKSIALSLHSTLDDNLISGDPERLQQIVWNLLSNAVKFTPANGQIEVRVQASHSMAQIQVIDSGKGISPNFLPYIFERFRQEDATTTRTQGGLGLGLAIVRNLVELHGGTIHVDSAGEGQGTTFTVYLPLLPSALPNQTIHYQGLQRQTTVDTVLNLSNVNVLIVDDERDTREFLQAALEQYGARVISAGSASEAWEFLQTHQPDILLSDVGMPDEDGFTLIRRIRSLPPSQGGHIPAAALTAYAREGDRLEALSAGFHLHIPKPIEPIQLLTVIVRLLETQKELSS
ncbi:MAG TPA: PAS domain-containing protein [Crinalium sp.]